MANKIHEFASSVYAVPYIETGDDRVDKRANYLIECLGYYSLMKSASSHLKKIKIEKNEEIRSGKISLDRLENTLEQHEVNFRGYQSLACEYCNQIDKTCTMHFRPYPNFARNFNDPEVRKDFVRKLQHKPKTSCMTVDEIISQRDIEYQRSLFTGTDVDI
ncbi:MAG: hypothetical protein WCP03_00390 [Candidatus Saccharibacteria bacterium]